MSKCLISRATCLAHRTESRFLQSHSPRAAYSLSQTRASSTNRNSLFGDTSSLLSRLSTQTTSQAPRPVSQSLPPSDAHDEVANLASRVQNVMLNPYPTHEPPYHLHVYAHKHNTHITFTRPNRDPLLSYSCGNIGFRKAQRSKYDASHQLSAYVMGKIQERGFLMNVKQLEIVLRGYGPGREAFTKALLGAEGRNLRRLVVRVTDATRLKFGGTRSRQKRRLG